jgi:hypothetical protein
MVLVAYLQTFLFVAASIVLFSAPFIGTFWWRHRAVIKRNKPHFNYFMEKFFLARESNWLVACWAAAEAIVWFVIPEFLLILLVFMKVRRKRELVIYDVAGTVVGTIIAIGVRFSTDTLVSLPYVTLTMVEKVNDWFSAWGVWAVVFQPFSGVPYKVFNAVAADYTLFIPAYIFLAVVARMIRYLMIYGVGVALYPVVHRYVRRHYAILLIAATAIFAALLMEVVSNYR